MKSDECESTHHDTAVCHRDVFESLHTEGPAAPLTLLGRPAQSREAIQGHLFVCLFVFQT